MSRIQELIKEKCPNGVVFKKIDSVAELYYGKGNNIPKDGGKYPVYGCYGIVGSTSTYNNEDTPIVGHIGSAGKVSWGKGKHYVTYNGTICKPKYENELNSKYLFYVLSNLNLEKYVKGSQPFLSSSDFGPIKIPIPPLEVQEEIVRILDKFGKLEAELEAELEARKQQYEFWSKELLNNRYKPYNLGDVLKIKNGKDYKHLEKGNIPVYGSGGIMTYVNKFSYDKPSVLIPRKGSLGNIFYLDTPFWNVDTIYYTEINNSVVIPKYVFYYIKNQHLENLNIAGGVPSMTQATLNKLKIFVPSLEEQQKIVNILDKFDKLINDISDGLPAEIEFRRKQYEYYRNKLLSFEELS